MNIRKLLKPSPKKIIIPLILTLSFLFVKIPFFSVFDFLNDIFSIISSVPIYIILITAMIFSGGGPEGMPVFQSTISLFVSLPIIFLIFYCIPAIFFDLFWDKFFGHFREKKHIYEIITGIFILLLFIAITIFIPYISYNQVYIEKIYTSENLDSNYIYDNNALIQEFTIKNDSLIDINYKLPEIAVCLLDIDTGEKIFYETTYQYENGNYVSDADKRHRKVILLPSKSKTKVLLISPVPRYLTNIDICSSVNLKHKYDKFLLISLNKELGYFQQENFCRNLSQKEIESAKEINIIKTNETSKICEPPIYVDINQLNEITISFNPLSEEDLRSKGKIIFEGLKISKIDNLTTENDDIVVFNETEIEFNLYANANNHDSFKIYTKGMEENNSCGAIKFKFDEDSDNNQFEMIGVPGGFFHSKNLDRRSEDQEWKYCI